ncbi:MAG: hypothetical protein R2699_09150 [Acidimicrobiales bacterium]
MADDLDTRRPWPAAPPPRRGSPPSRGLAEAVDDLESPFGRTSSPGETRRSRATGVIAAGPAVAPRRRRQDVSRVLRTFTRLGDLANLTAAARPRGWAMEAAIEAFADQLALAARRRQRSPA